MKELKTFKQFENYFLPNMPEQANEVRKMKGMGIWKARKLAARAFKRFSGMNITEAYE
jgi:predicted small integral membrane protein